MPTQSTVQISSQINSSNNLLIIGRKEHLNQDNLCTHLEVPQECWKDIFSILVKKNKVVTIQNGREIIIAILPEACSRHNSPSRAWAITDLCNFASGDSDWDIVLCTPEVHHNAAVAASAKAFPSYTAKSSQISTRTINILLFANQQFHTNKKYDNLISGIRLAASLFDRPTSDLNVSAFINEAKRVAQENSQVTTTIIRGKELPKQGFGGIWGVGKAASDPPALVCLQWKPKNAISHVAWVGKGIVYDTGGLSIKSKTGMPNMKGDMGGAAAVLGAFLTAIKNEVPYAISAILCLAENSVGPESTRPDDVLYMYSGKTVEVNNTDAEGRLVLADGVAWAAKVLEPNVLIDIATLTGAAPIAVGKQFAALYSNDDNLEQYAVRAGRDSGECCHPLPYVPEFFKQEFTSHIADMKNSVKDRANGQSACAGQFIKNHISDTKLPWLHIDIAGPAWNRKKRGTGYGVALLLMIGSGPV
jgi:probable aminopeptidase NPEPL1